MQQPEGADVGGAEFHHALGALAVGAGQRLAFHQQDVQQAAQHLHQLGRALDGQQRRQEFAAHAPLAGGVLLQLAQRDGVVAVAVFLLQHQLDVQLQRRQIGRKRLGVQVGHFAMVAVEASGAGAGLAIAGIAAIRLQLRQAGV